MFQFNWGPTRKWNSKRSFISLLNKKEYTYVTLSIDFLHYLLKLQIFECKYWWGCQGNKDTKASILLLQANSLHVKSLENVLKNASSSLTWQGDSTPKVVYPKYSKRWPYTVAHRIDCVCSKMLHHGLFLSFFKLISCPIQKTKTPALPRHIQV